jgi:putative transposase
MPRRKEPRIPDAVLDQLLAGGDAKAAFDPSGLLDELKKALAERALNAEMDHHLSGEAAEGRSNSRNGYGQKTVLTDTGRIALEVPRDRLSTFDPQLIAKYGPHRASAMGTRPAALSRLRREDRLNVRPRHERARDPRPSA